MTSITRGLPGTRIIWIDHARGGAARCRGVALRQRRVAAFVIAASPACTGFAGSYVWAAAGPTDIVPIAKIEGQNAHQNLLVDCPPLPASAGFSDEGDKSLVPSQFTFARWGRPRAGTRSPRSKLADQGTSDSPSPRRVAYPYGSPAGCRRASNPRQRDFSQ
jgi:hypothetical protein